MKLLNKYAAILALTFFTVNANAQRIKLTEGSLDVLKNETSINVEFTYNNMSVGKFDKESEYV